VYIYTRQLSGLGYALGNSQPRAKAIYAAQSLIKPLNDSNFWNIFSDRNRVVVVSFWNDSSRNCDVVAKVMSSIAQKYSKGVFSRLVNFYQIEWDPKVNPKIHQRFGLKGMPVVYFYFTSTGNPPDRAAPLLEGSLGPTDKWHDPAQYEWRIRSILRRRISEVRIILIDLPQFLKVNPAIRNKLTSELEAKLNNIVAPENLVQERLMFRVEYRSSEPKLQEKRDFGRLDFPIYFLGSQHSSKTVQKLMEQHQIPDNIKCPRIKEAFDPYKRAEDWWKEPGRRGLGLPSGQGSRKIGFIRANKIAEDPAARRDLPQAFLNITAHELGHMFNLCDHSTSGLMKYPVSLIDNVDFLTGETGLVVNDLRRLRDLR
jgi:thiol-disulfide isomerase/thioredoxin